MFIRVSYFHRHLTHQTIRYSKPMVVFIKTINWLTLVSKYDLYFEREFVATHSLHHQKPDVTGDPHSPYFTFTWPTFHIDRFNDEEAEKRTNHLVDLQPNGYDQFLSKLPGGFYLILVPLTLIWGWKGVIAAFIFKQGKWFGGTLANFVGHTFPGYTNAKLNNGARNIPPYLMPLLVGEDLHGNHHKWANRANFAVRWWEIDIVYQILRILSWFGLVKILGDTKLISTDNLKIEYKGWYTY